MKLWAQVYLNFYLISQVEIQEQTLVKILLLVLLKQIIYEQQSQVSYFIMLIKSHHVSFPHLYLKQFHCTIIISVNLIYFSIHYLFIRHSFYQSSQCLFIFILVMIYLHIYSIYTYLLCLVSLFSLIKVNFTSFYLIQRHLLSLMAHLILQC